MPIYYDCLDSEELTLESPEEALCELVECYLTKDCDVEKVIREKVGSVTVDVFETQTISDKHLRRLSERAVEGVEEDLGDEFGDPNGEFSVLGEKEHVETLKIAIQMLFKEHLRQHQKIWSCDQIGTNEYSVEEVIAIVKKERPEWFD